jgi:hypothetical protein
MDSTAHKARLHNGTSDSPLVTEAHTATLTNKTFDADGTGNSISNIEDADIKAGAAIARSKLAAGTADHVLINDGDGVMSSEAQLSISRGGTGQSTAQAAIDALLPSQTGNAGRVLGTNGTTASWQNPGAPNAPTIQKFTSGSGTYTTPTSPSPLYIRVRMVGGGGGGGGSADPAGDAGQGGTGGTTTFGTALLTANGGVGGRESGVAAGPGGSASISAPGYGTALSGGDGAPAAVTSFNGGKAGGNGGSSAFGGAGAGGFPNSVADSGTTGKTNTGGGGGGASNNSSGGFPGAGGGSGGFVDAIIPSPSATYAYAVGAAGTAGAAGTNGVAGSAGADGYIEVTEYYQ